MIIIDLAQVFANMFGALGWFILSAAVLIGGAYALIGIAKALEWGCDTIDKVDAALIDNAKKRGWRK